MSRNDSHLQLQRVGFIGIASGVGGAPSAARQTVAGILDAVAEAHRHIEHPAVPATDFRGSVGLIEFLSLKSAGCIDLEHFARHISASGNKMAHQAGMVLADQLLGGLEAAHASSGGPYLLGSICFANVLLAQDGTASILGFGANFPMRSEPGALTVNPGTAQPMEPLGRFGAKPCIRCMGILYIVEALSSVR